MTIETLFTAQIKLHFSIILYLTFSLRYLFNLLIVYIARELVQGNKKDQRTSSNTENEGSFSQEAQVPLLRTGLRNRALVLAVLIPGELNSVPVLPVVSTKADQMVQKNEGILISLTNSTN